MKKQTINRNNDYETIGTMLRLEGQSGRDGKENEGFFKTYSFEFVCKNVRLLNEQNRDEEF